MNRDIFIRIILSIFIIFLIFGLHRLMTIRFQPVKPALDHDRPLLFAHRGGGALAPENTVPAFLNGVRLGADALELDVRITADDQVVVFHDETLERTTNGNGKVREHTLAELVQLDAGYYFSSDDGATYPYRDQGVTIPTLAEVYAEFPTQLINIDIKDPLPEAAERLAVVIEEAGATDRTIVGSFHSDILTQFRSLAPAIATAASKGEVRAFYLFNFFGLGRLHRPLADVYQIPTSTGGVQLGTDRFIQNAHRLNQAVHYWTIDDPDEMRRLLEIGADGIITDRPDLALEIFQELGYK